jgi:hypothetical protein
MEWKKIILGKNDIIIDHNYIGILYEKLSLRLNLDQFKIL